MAESEGELARTDEAPRVMGVMGVMDVMDVMDVMRAGWRRFPL